MPKTKTEMAELKEYISGRFDKIEAELAEIKSEVAQVKDRVLVIETKLETVKDTNDLLLKKLPDVSERFGELKNWRQIAFVVMAAVAGWFARRM